MKAVSYIISYNNVRVQSLLMLWIMLLSSVIYTVYSTFVFRLVLLLLLLQCFHAIFMWKLNLPKLKPTLNHGNYSFCILKQQCWWLGTVWTEITFFLRLVSCKIINHIVYNIYIPDENGWWKKNNIIIRSCWPEQ